MRRKRGIREHWREPKTREERIWVWILIPVLANCPNLNEPTPSGASVFTTSSLSPGSSRWVCLRNMMDLCPEGAACVQSLKKAWLPYTFAWDDLCLGFLHASHSGEMVSLTTLGELAPCVCKTGLHFFIKTCPQTTIFPAKSTIKQAKHSISNLDT